MRILWSSVVALVTLVAVTVAGVALSDAPRRTPTVATALASMPAETLTASVTDWGQMRRLLRGPGGSAGLLGRAYETDLSAVSALGDAAGVMAERYGWSVLDAHWEGLAQSRRGAALIVQLPPDFDLDRVREGLERLGYERPFEADGVWRGGFDVVASIDPSLSPLLAHAVVLDETRRVVFSDTRAYAARTAGVVQGSVASLGQREPAGAVADRLRGAVAGVVHTRSRGCQVMGFGRASGADQAVARQRFDAVGGLQRYASMGIALLAGPGDDARRTPLVVAMHFEDASAIPGEAARRARLAGGVAPGQGGTYGSRFTVASATQRGGDVVLRLRPREAEAQLLSDLNSGELLFAACGPVGAPS